MGLSCCKCANGTRPSIFCDLQRLNESEHVSCNGNELSQNSWEKNRNVSYSPGNNIERLEATRQAENNLREHLRRSANEESSDGFWKRRPKLSMNVFNKLQSKYRNNSDTEDYYSLDPDKKSKTPKNQNTSYDVHNPYYVNYKTAKEESKPSIINDAETSATKDSSTENGFDALNNFFDITPQDTDVFVNQKNSSPNTSASTAPSIRNSL